MYKTFLHIVLLCIPLVITAQQNLVPNPSFELYDSCPTAFSVPGDYQISYATHWYSPTYATSDYFNSCNFGNVSVPSNSIGFQYAKNGDAYAGIILEFGSPHWFEYIQTKLNYPLMQGVKYKLSFFVSLANNADFAVKKVGAWFTVDSVSSSTFLPLFDYLPEIRSDSTVFLSDTLNWMKIEGEFIANGGERYMTIGYYSDTSFIDTLRINPFASSASFFVYYYIDEIALKEVEQTIVIPNIITPNNDKINDAFRLNFPYKKTSIYNRWGKLIFEDKSGHIFWNGTNQKGQQVPDGIYFYLIITKKQVLKGWVQVLR